MKKALLIGINYTGQDGQLNGCVNDINNIKSLLINKWGYKNENITLLLDNNATDANMEAAILKLTTGCTAGYILFFYYSGHGAAIGNIAGAPRADQDDALIPVDYKLKGVISDDWLYANLAMKVPEKVVLWAFADCCHSGSMLDLKYNWMCSPTRAPNTPVNTKYIPENWTNNFTVSVINSKETNGNVFLFSGCEDAQKSTDTFINNQYQGAFTACFLECISNKSNNATITIGDILKEIDCLLVMKNYHQRSQLSVGKSSDINFIFKP
jgi:hypothetical protein